MKLSEPLWAIVTPSGDICGDGECSCLSSSKDLLEDELPFVQRMDVYRGIELAVVPVVIARRVPPVESDALRKAA